MAPFAAAVTYDDDNVAHGWYHAHSHSKGKR